MTPELVAAIVGIVISLALEYVPRLKEWYGGQSEASKKLIALGIGFVVVAGAFGLGCANLIAPYWACTGIGAWEAFLVFLAYLGANQTTYALFLNKNK